MASFIVRVQVEKNGREVFSYARGVELDEDTGVGTYEKTPAVGATNLPLSELSTLELLLVSVDQDNALLALNGGTGINLMTGGVVLVVNGSMAGSPLGTITYNGSNAAQVTVLGGGT